MRLDRSVVLVTGASGGIGRALAQGFADRGAHVIAHGRDADRLADVARATGATALTADLADAADVERLAEQALAVRGRVDVLVANAGIGWSGAFDTMTGDHLRRMIEVDLVAPLQLTRLLLPTMLQRRCGHVCFVSSVAGRTGVAGEAVYAAAKAGLDAFAESLRAEAAGTGVGVSTVVPGAVRTEFFTTRGRAYDRRVPRPVEPEAVAAQAIRAVEDDHAEVWVPSWLRVAGTTRAVLPGAFRRLSQRFGEPVRLSGSTVVAAADPAPDPAEVPPA
jgi:short-subunit dehydrogenase